MGEDAKRWKATENELERELAIAKDHEKAMHQHSKKLGAMELRSDVVCATSKATTGISARIAAAAQPSQPLPTFSSSNSGFLSTSAGVAGQSGLSVRGSGRNTGDGDRSCQQQ